MRTDQLYRKRIIVLAIGLMTFVFSDAFAQKKISTSPTRLNYKISPGGTQRGLITVTNNSELRQEFKVDFGDFDATRSGKSKFLEKGVLPRSCANWLSASPTLFTLDPGENQQIEVTMDVPQDSAAVMARWAVAYIRLAGERQGEQKSDDGLIVNLNQSYRFGVYIFQTPPSATYAKGELIGFEQQDDHLLLQLRNIGETFLKCNSYAEFTNLQTGETQRIDSRQFTVLPASNRDVAFAIPRSIPPGKYSVLGVLDYGNRDQVEAAEIEITIPERSNQNK